MNGSVAREIEVWEDEGGAAPVSLRISAMTGTPNQVEWAERIKNRVNCEFDRVATSFRSIAAKQVAGKRADTEAVIAILEQKRAEMMSRDQAVNIRPLNDRIVVKRIEGQGTTHSGIVIPDSAKEKPQEGEVMAVGRGKRLTDGTLAALGVKAGDRVLFEKYSGSETKLDGTEYIIIREDDVLAAFVSPAEAAKKST